MTRVCRPAVALALSLLLAPSLEAFSIAPSSLLRRPVGGSHAPPPLVALGRGLCPSLTPLSASGPSKGADGAVQSPFEKAVEVKVGDGDGELAFTQDNVDEVLNEIRPYLIADGGNCRVVSVDAASGDVELQLEGACGTCPSSTVTMKQGIERVLRENFGERLGQVVSVQPAAAELLTIEDCEKLLAPVRPAVEGLGGSVEVTGIEDATGTVTLKYSGPEKLVYGIELTLMDHELVRKVVVE